MLKNPTAYALSWGYAAGIVIGAGSRGHCREKRNQRGNFKFFLQAYRADHPVRVAVRGHRRPRHAFYKHRILIISWMKTAADVGVYSAAIRFIQVLYIVPGILQMSSSPVLTACQARQRKIPNRARTDRQYDLPDIAPLAIGGAILGTQIMTFIFGNAFASGSLAFKLLVITLIADYPGAIIVNAIFTYAHRKSLIVSSAIGATINVALDLILIPRFGMTGSAVGTLIAQIVTNWYLSHILKKINYFEIVPHLGKMAVAALAMGIATLALYFAGMNVILNIVISGGVLLGCLMLFRESALEQIIAIVRPNAAKQ